MGVHDTEKPSVADWFLMKIAVVMPLAEQRGGAELTLCHLMSQGRGMDVEWLVIFFEDGPMVAQFQKMGIKTRVVRAGRLRELSRFLRAVGQITNVLRQFGAETVVSWMATPHLYASLAALRIGIPSLWYQHGLALQASPIDQLATLLPARGILACSEAAARAQRRRRPRRPVHVVYPGVELERFDPDRLLPPVQARAALGLPTHGPLIGIVGRLQHWKGIHTFVEAMPHVRRDYPGAHAVIVGGAHHLEPEYSALVESRIAALDLESCVIMAGLQHNIPEWMQTMDVVVHASDREPFGIVILEAMALGKPVVAGDEGGPREIITDGVNGLLSPYGDAPALARSVLRYLNMPEFACQVGAAARQRAQDFSVHNYAQRCFAVVKELSKAEV